MLGIVEGNRRAIAHLRSSGVHSRYVATTVDANDGRFEHAVSVESEELAASRRYHDGGDRESRQQSATAHPIRLSNFAERDHRRLGAHT
jgi:hypothetical protein